MDYTFDAIAGRMGDSQYYSAMIPIKYLSQLFEFQANVAAPLERSQRTLNPGRAGKICRYVLENPNTYIFDSLSVSIQGEYEFSPHGNSPLRGQISIAMDAKLILLNGQHRHQGLINALIIDPSLGSDHINVLLFPYFGIERDQQRFCDLNSGSQVNVALARLYNSRDEAAHVTRQLLSRVALLERLTELEKNSIPKTSSKLFTFNGLHEAVTVLVHPDDTTEEIIDTAQHFFELLIPLFPRWQAVFDGTCTASEVRSQGIETSAIALVAMAHLAKLPNWESLLPRLAQVDWSRDNPDFTNRVLYGGKIIKRAQTVGALAQYLKDCVQQQQILISL